MSLAVYAVLMIIHFGIIAFGVEPPPNIEGKNAQAEPAAIIRTADRRVAE
jgi:hypothetical protein